MLEHFIFILSAHAVWYLFSLKNTYKRIEILALTWDLDSVCIHQWPRLIIFCITMLLQ